MIFSLKNDVMGILLLPVPMISSVLADKIELTDSLQIEGYYSIRGKEVKRPRLEKMLLKRPYAELPARGARNYRYAANGIGAAMWCVSIGAAALQIRNVVDAVENNESITGPLGQSSMPLLIGGDVSSVVSSLMRSHSDYLLYKAAREHNRRCTSDSMVMPIEKIKSGWYRQGTLMLPEHVLVRVLKEYEEPEGLVAGAMVLKNMASLFSTAGACFLYYGIMGFIEPQGVDVPRRNIYLGVGIGLTGCVFFDSFIASWLTKKAVVAYNNEVNSSRQPGN
jgi:hypothetical protein